MLVTKWSSLTVGHLGGMQMEQEQINLLKLYWNSVQVLKSMSAQIHIL